MIRVVLLMFLGLLLGSLLMMPPLPAPPPPERHMNLFFWTRELFCTLEATGEPCGPSVLGRKPFFVYKH